MASLFGHAFIAISIGTSYAKKLRSLKFWLLGIFCAILPDADVIGFSFEIAYQDFWGHRGFTHSFLFAFIVGIFMTLLFYSKALWSLKGLSYILFFFLCTASHSILDAMTTGGLGVAFFAPFDNTRHFFSWRPIQVSPIGVKNFFSEWGLKVIISELIWIVIPCLAYIVSSKFIKNILKK